MRIHEPCQPGADEANRRQEQHLEDKLTSAPLK